MVSLRCVHIRGLSEKYWQQMWYMNKCLISLGATVTHIYRNPLPCDEPCPKSSGTYGTISRLIIWIFMMDHPAACITSTGLKLLALDGTVHLWEQIKVTRTHGRIVGRICQSFQLPPSLGFFTGLATEQCALSCSTIVGARVMKCIFFCCTARCRWFSRNLTQYSAFTVWLSQTWRYHKQYSASLLTLLHSWWSVFIGNEPG
jgi:hypothetical protein